MKQLPKNDLQITFTRGNGPGGQHKNKVETCCEIIHLPTQIKERCQDSRSKTANYELALSRVTKRVNDLISSKQAQLLNEKRKESFETVIRTYNEKRGEVKDHRTQKVANYSKFLDGHLELLNSLAIY